MEAQYMWASVDGCGASGFELSHEGGTSAKKSAHMLEAQPARNTAVGPNPCGRQTGVESRRPLEQRFVHLPPSAAAAWTMTAAATAEAATTDDTGTVLDAMSVDKTAAVQRDLVTRVLTDGAIGRVAGCSRSHVLLDGSPLAILVNNPGRTPVLAGPRVRRPASLPCTPRLEARAASSSPAGAPSPPAAPTPAAAGAPPPVADAGFSLSAG